MIHQVVHSLGIPLFNVIMTRRWGWVVKKVVGVSNMTKRKSGDFDEVLRWRKVTDHEIIAGDK